jgi:hypothetical protein
MQQAGDGNWCDISYLRDWKRVRSDSGQDGGATASHRTSGRGQSASGHAGICLWVSRPPTCLLFFAFHPAMAQSTTEHTPYYLGAPEIDIGWTPGESPASTPQEIEDISTSRHGRLNLGPVERPLIFLSKQTDALERATWLQLAVAYTMPFHAGDRKPGRPLRRCRRLAPHIHVDARWTRHQE